MAATKRKLREGTALIYPNRNRFHRNSPDMRGGVNLHGAIFNLHLWIVADEETPDDYYMVGVLREVDGIDPHLTPFLLDTEKVPENLATKKLITELIKQNKP